MSAVAVDSKLSHHPSSMYNDRDELDYPIADKTLNSLFMFQVNFNDLKKVLDYLMANQKKQQYLIDQLIDSKVKDGSIKVIEKLVHLPSRDYDKPVSSQNIQESEQYLGNNSARSNQESKVGSFLDQNGQNLQSQQQNQPLKSRQSSQLQGGDRSREVDTLKNICSDLEKKIKDLEDKSLQTDSILGETRTELDVLKLNQQQKGLIKKKTMKDNQASNALQFDKEENRLNDLQMDLDRVKQNVIDIEALLQRSDRSSRRYQTQDGLPIMARASSNHRNRDLSDDSKDKLRALEIKTTDLEQKIKLLLQSGRRNLNNSLSGLGSRSLSKGLSTLEDKQNNNNQLQVPSMNGDNMNLNEDQDDLNTGAGGFDIGDIILLIDTMKEDLRKEFTSKYEIDKLQGRLGIDEQDLDDMTLTMGLDSRKIKENSERLDQQSEKINNNTNQIIELANQIQKLNEQIKNKAESEDVESIHNFVNDLYDRLQDLEKHSGHGDGTIKPPIQRVQLGGNSALGSRGGNSGDVQSQIRDLYEKFSSIINDVTSINEIKDKIKDIYNQFEKKANIHDLSKATQQIDDLKTKKAQMAKDIESLKKFISEKNQATVDQVTQVKNSLLLLQNKFNEAQVKNVEIQKLVQERGSLFGLGLEDEKKIDEEMINEINEKINNLANEIKKTNKSIEGEVAIIDQKLQEKVDNSAIPKIEEKILQECDKLIQKMLKRVAEKQELQAVVKHFDKLIKNLHTYIKNKFSMVEENDDAILSKKPLGGFSCASCEKGIKNLSLQANLGEFNSWNKMPQREPIAKIGQGFSKILQMIKPGMLTGENQGMVGTARQLLNESTSFMPNFTKNSLHLDEANNIVNNVEISRLSNMNSTAPNFNNNFEFNLHITGSQTARNGSLPPQLESKEEVNNQVNNSLIEKNQIENTTILNRPKLSKGPILVKGGKILGSRSQSNLPQIQNKNQQQPL